MARTSIRGTCTARARHRTSLLTAESHDADRDRASQRSCRLSCVRVREVRPEASRSASCQPSVPLHAMLDTTPQRSALLQEQSCRPSCHSVTSSETEPITNDALCEYPDTTLLSHLWSGAHYCNVISPVASSKRDPKRRVVLQPQFKSMKPRMMPLQVDAQVLAV